MGAHRNDPWRERLEEADYVVITAALTPESRHLIGVSELRRMKPEAWVINVSRGGLIDHDALAEALHDGRPRGAYLDVTDPEPLPRDTSSVAGAQRRHHRPFGRPQRTLARAICHPVSR